MGSLRSAAEFRWPLTIHAILDGSVGRVLDAVKVVSRNRLDSRRVIQPVASPLWFITGRGLDDGPVRSPEHRLDRASALAAYT